MVSRVQSNQLPAVAAGDADRREVEVKEDTARRLRSNEFSTESDIDDDEV